MSLRKYRTLRRRSAAPATPLQEAIQTGAIPPDSAEILRDLLKLRVATPSNLALETGRLGQGLSEKLEQLEANGWVKSEPIINGVEKKIYYPSSQYIKSRQLASRSSQSVYSH
ncbi:MAG: hypothetical protein GC158_09740 [Cyanobacteria bacterium RI_101]|nr:hypothetical protein [Cyanobacteria bacterium RI_101]